MPLRYGTRVVGVIVVSKLGLNQFDEDDVRLLEVLAGHAAVAVENASLYESARREAESATSLLEFGRELATLVDLDDIAGRVTELSAEILGSRNTSFYLETDGELRLHGRARPLAGDGRRARSRSPFRSRRSTSTAIPYIAEPSDYEPAIGREAPVPGGRYAVAPFDVDGRAGCLVALVEREDFGERELALLGGLAQQAKLAIANASSYEGLERTFVSTVEALANALEANDEYTSTHARWITRPLAARRPGARPRRARAEAPRARRAAPRHRQDRHPERRALEAGTADRRRAEDRPDASGARRADHRPDRPAPGRAADRPPLPRALGRRAATPTASPARTSRSSRGSSSSATRTTR